MLYYGDRSRDVDVREVVARLRQAMAGAPSTPEARPERLRAALIEAGELAQALADAARARAGWDEIDPAAEAALAVAVALARALLSAGKGEGGPPGVAPLERLEAADLPERVRVQVPEGYACYAVYPECYAEAAAALAGGPPVVVIGLRSIGTSLAAAVAAACGAQEVVTVRPSGHPYQRSLALGPRLAARLVAAVEGGAAFAVVDEGPGASGSSFAAAARWLEAAGLPSERLLLFPSHGGAPGPAAAPGTQRDWARWPKVTVSFEAAILPRLQARLRAVTGSRPLEDLSAGRWRARISTPAPRWPPVFAQQERRKYLASGAGAPLLFKFAGLGRYGQEALARARALGEGGWSAPAAGLIEGFLVHAWVAGARALPEVDLPRCALAEHVARYLAFRSRALPAPDRRGSGEALLEMLRVNATEGLGGSAAEAVQALEAGAAEASRLPAAAVDGKLEAWEWLVTSEGRLLKTDGVDHAAGHDLVQGQPMAWDVAGAAFELGLDPDEAAALARAAAPEASGAALRFFRAAYLAHRLGRWTFALGAEGDPGERGRIAAAQRRYREALAAALGLGASGAAAR
jgi:hypothetical protein